MKKKKNNYVVYSIIVNDIVRYIGRSKQFDIRKKAHLKGIKNKEKKQIYDYVNTLVNPNVEFIIIKQFKTFIDMKRYEALLILQDYFGNRMLLQKVPNISDR